MCENSPNSLCHFWNHESFFAIQLVCIILAQTLDTSDKHIPSKDKFSDFALLRLKFLMSFFKQKVSLSFGSRFSVMRITLLNIFSWNCTWFGQKEPISVQNFTLSTAHVKFHQMCTLIGSLILAKKYRGVISHDTEDWCKIWRKTDLLFQKSQEFGEI